MMAGMEEFAYLMGAEVSMWTGVDHIAFVVSRWMQFCGGVIFLLQGGKCYMSGRTTWAS